jgi:hypothetical protein
MEDNMLLTNLFKDLATELGLDVYEKEDVLTLVGDDVELVISEETLTTFTVVKNYYYNGSHLCGTHTFEAQSFTDVVTLVFMSTASEDLRSAHYRGETEVLNKACEDAKFAEELMRSIEIFWEENVRGN